MKKVDLSDVKIAHMSGIFPGISDTAEETFRALFKRLNENNILTTFDPNLRPLWKSHDYMVKTINELAGYADIVLPGVEEGKILMGSDDPEAIADFYLKGERTNTVIVKIGAEGAFVKTSNGDKYTVKASTLTISSTRLALVMVSPWVSLLPCLKANRSALQ